MSDSKQEHLRLLAVAFYEGIEFIEGAGAGSPGLCTKRPFGNSGYEADILEIIGAEPEEKEEDGDGYMVWSSEQYEYARKLYAQELTPYLKEHAIKYFKALTPKQAGDE
jgi:hypothetical protein